MSPSKIDLSGFITLLNGVFPHPLPDDVLETRLIYCGGDSILAATLAARCFRQYGVRVPVSLILSSERLHEVFDYVREHATGAPVAASPRVAKVPGRFAQNAAQRLIYYAHSVDPATTAYNIPLILRTASRLLKYPRNGQTYLSFPASSASIFSCSPRTAAKKSANLSFDALNWPVTANSGPFSAPSGTDRHQ